MFLGSLLHDPVKPSLLCVTELCITPTSPAIPRVGYPSDLQIPLMSSIVPHKNPHVPSREGIFSLRGMWGTEPKKTGALHRPLQGVV